MICVAPRVKGGSFGNNTATNYVDAPWGDYTFQTSFTVTNLASQSITISGEWAADNLLMGIALNGQTVFKAQY
jgi:hypothetical protein